MLLRQHRVVPAAAMQEFATHVPFPFGREAGMQGVGLYSAVRLTDVADGSSHHEAGVDSGSTFGSRGKC